MRSLLAQAHSVRKGSEVEPTLQLEQRGPRGRLVRSDLSHCMKNRRIPPPLPHREHLCPLCCQMPWKPYFLPLTHSLTLCNLTATSTHLRLILWGHQWLFAVILRLFFCACYLKHLMLLNTPFLKDVPYPTAVWLLRHNTSLLSVCVFALFSLVSSLPLLSRRPQYRLS